MIEQDNKQYFSYGVGLKFRYRDKDKEFILEIIDCYLNLNEVEYYIGTNDGKRMQKAMSCNRLKFLLNNNCTELMSEGERREMPLLREEVELYYTRIVKPKVQARRAAEQKLRETPYYELERDSNKLVLAITLGEIQGADCKELRDEYERKKREQRTILQNLGISEEALCCELKACNYCGGTGFVFSYAAKDNRAICPCAYERKTEIKSYALAERLKLR